ncbi:GNAT family N-acetyltransferase [Pontimicrobium sp. MEBiC01747]
MTPTVRLSNNLQLTPVTISSQSKLYKLMETIYPPVYKHLWVNEDCSFYINLFYSKKPLEKELLEPDSHYYFVEYNNETVGIIRIRHNQTSPNSFSRLSTYINRIYLGTQAQGKGVAKQLFHWITTQAIAHNNNVLWLKAMDTQKQALKFYLKEGFTITGKSHLNFELLHEPLRGMVIMQKELHIT